MTGMEPNMDALAQRIAARGRDALVERLRTAYADATAAHADIVALDDQRIEAMVQTAADRADGLQWRRALADVAADELGVSVTEALSHPAVVRAQVLVGAPTYEQSLAELITQPVPPPAGTGNGSEATGAPAGAPVYPVAPPPALSPPAEPEPPAAPAPALSPPAEPEPEPEPEPELEHEPEPELEPEAQLEAEPEAEPEAEAQLEAQPELEPEAQLELAPAPAPGPEAIAEPELETAPEPEAGTPEPTAEHEAVAPQPIEAHEDLSNELEAIDADDAVFDLLPEPDPIELETELYEAFPEYIAEDPPPTLEPGPFVPENDDLLVTAIHLGGVANLPASRNGLDLRLSAKGLDILHSNDEIVGRLPWEEIDALEVPHQRVRRRRQHKPRARLLVRTKHGDASFEIPGVSSDELRDRIEPLISRYGHNR
jgi:hypothetical protein